MSQARADSSELFVDRTLERPYRRQRVTGCRVPAAVPRAASSALSLFNAQAASHPSGGQRTGSHLGRRPTHGRAGVQRTGSVALHDRTPGVQRTGSVALGDRTPARDQLLNPALCRDQRRIRPRVRPAAPGGISQRQGRLDQDGLSRLAEARRSTDRKGKRSKRLSFLRPND
jgi:hypothetical protein